MLGNPFSPVPVRMVVHPSSWLMTDWDGGKRAGPCICVGRLRAPLGIRPELGQLILPLCLAASSLMTDLTSWHICPESTSSINHLLEKPHLRLCLQRIPLETPFSFLRFFSLISLLPQGFSCRTFFSFFRFCHLFSYFHSQLMALFPISIFKDKIHHKRTSTNSLPTFVLFYSVLFLWTCAVQQKFWSPEKCSVFKLFYLSAICDP